jgi:hypothetical protein
MKLTKSLLRKIIKEELEVHFAPENLTDLDPEEAYGLGWQAGDKVSSITVDDKLALEPIDSVTTSEENHYN